MGLRRAVVSPGAPKAPGPRMGGEGGPIEGGGGASGSHQRGGLTAVAAPDSSLSVVDSMGEVDK
jgi:hypothetical protein